jgi:hypothetical protein
MEAIGMQTMAVRGRTGRVAVLLALVFVAGVSLRGRLPDTRPGPRGGSGDSPFTLAGLIVLLGVSLLVTGFALLTAARRPKPAVAAGRHDVPGGLGAGKGRWQLRLVLIALGLVLASVVAFVVAQQIRLGAGFGQTMPVSEAPDGTPVAPRPPPQGRAERDAFWYLVGTTALMTVMIVASGVVSALKRPRPESTAVLSATAAPVQSDPEPLTLAAERGLAEVGDLSREPREAIIACYAAMESALAEAPGAAPQASDTPTEVLARAVGKRALSAGNASTLVELFTEARFSRHVMTEQHRDVAEQALRSVLGELRSRQ